MKKKEIGPRDTGNSEKIKEMIPMINAVVVACLNPVDQSFKKQAMLCIMHQGTIDVDSESAQNVFSSFQRDAKLSLGINFCDC